jgi:hypothetical protein
MKARIVLGQAWTLLVDAIPGNLSSPDPLSVMAVFEKVAAPSER